MTDSPSGSNQPTSLVLNVVQAPPPPSGPKRFDLTQIASVDKNDLTAIVTARHEASVRNEIRTIHARLSEATATLSSIRKKMTDAFESFVLSFPLSPLADLIKPLSAVGFPADLTASGTYSPRTPSRSWNRRSDLGSTTSNPRTSILITSRLSIDGGSSSFTLHHGAEIPADLLTLFNQEAAAERDVATLDAELMNARQRLTNIPSVERAARAAIAENALRSSGEDGVALLNSLSSVNPMPLLPETRPAYKPGVSSPD